MKFRTKRLLVSAAVAALSISTLAACGSSSKSAGSSGDSSTADNSSSGVSQEIIDYVKEHSVIPKTIGVTEKVSKPIPTGKRLVYINCGAQACTNIGNAMQEATKVLGWQFININTQPTPQAIQAAFQQAINLKPDGVSSGGFATSSYQRQLAELKAMNIPVISQTGTDEPGNGLILQLMDPPYMTQVSKLLADKMIVDQNGQGLLGLVTLSGYPSQEGLTQGVKDEITKECPKCTTKTLEVAPTAIGTTAASSIANFLRANPTMKEIYLSYDDLANGLRAAVANAGGTYPKTVSWAPTQNGIQALLNGDRTAAVDQYEPEMGWQLADAFARIFVGDDPSVDNTFSPFFLWGKEYNNLPTTTDNPSAIPNYQDQFKALWGK